LILGAQGINDMSRPVFRIAFNGAKESGKSTACKYLERKYDAKIIAFASPLKSVVAEAFGLDVRDLHDPEKKRSVLPEFGVTPRQLLQVVGTELFRKELIAKLPELGAKLGMSIWAYRTLCTIRATSGNIAVEDLRFDDEARLVKAEGFLRVKIVRPGLKVEEDKHESELGCETDIEIVNDGTISQLEAKLDALVKFAAAPSLGRTLYLVRHAQSKWNAASAEDRAAPSMHLRDADLTDEGVAQLKRLRETMPPEMKAASIIYCSPLTRAIRTAQAIAEETKAAIIVVPCLREIRRDISDIGRDRAELAAQFPTLSLSLADNWWDGAKDRTCACPPRDECGACVAARKKEIRQLFDNAPAVSIVVTHSALLLDLYKWDAGTAEIRKEIHATY
jgi:broad specificity phosphatase PhoE